MHGQGNRIDRGGDHIGSGTGRLDRRGERVTSGTLRVQANGQAGDLVQLLDELTRAMGLQHSGGVVQQQPGGAQLGQPLGGVDERLVAAAAVEQPGLELLAGADDRLGGLAQVVDVVERIVQPEDVDAALGCTGDEPARKIATDGSRTDQEASAQRERQRRLRPCFERADALPRAFDASPDSVVEDASPGDLEVGEARLVENLGEPQDLGRRHPAGQRFLAEDADGRVDEARHEVGHYPVPSEPLDSAAEAIGEIRSAQTWTEPGQCHSIEGG